MRSKLRLIAFVIGAGMLLIGVPTYLSTTQSAPLSDPEAFISALKVIIIASVFIVIGAWLSIKAISPNTS